MFIAWVYLVLAYLVTSFHLFDRYVLQQQPNWQPLVHFLEGFRGLQVASVLLRRVVDLTDEIVSRCVVVLLHVVPESYHLLLTL